MSSKYSKQAREKLKPETTAFIRMSVAVSLRVQELMEQRKMSQNDLAQKLDKTPAEISRWLSGMHNFTLRSIGKLEDVFGEPILKKTISVAEKEQEINALKLKIQHLMEALEDLNKDLKEKKVLV